MLIKKFIKGIEVPIYIKDNNSKNTVVFVHGYHSSHQFIGTLGIEKNNYNIVSFSFPGAKDVAIDHQTSFAELRLFLKKILKHVRHSKIFLFGHSLGGGLAASVADCQKVEGLFLLNPINPFMVETPQMKFLKALMAPSNAQQKIFNALLKGLKTVVSEDVQEKINVFMDKENSWHNVVKENILNDEFMTGPLDEFYQQVKNKMHVIVSLKDKVINSEKSIRYFTDVLGVHPVIIGETHSPLSINCQEFNTFLNQKITVKQRNWFTKKLKIWK